MTPYILEIDIEKFFPGTWDKMTKEEQAAWRRKWHACLARRKGNNGVTHEQQKLLQSNHG